jgi:hypothetical protein
VAHAISLWALLGGLCLFALLFLLYLPLQLCFLLTLQFGCALNASFLFFFELGQRLQERFLSLFVKHFAQLDEFRRVFPLFVPGEDVKGKQLDDFDSGTEVFRGVCAAVTAQPSHISLRIR